MRGILSGDQSVPVGTTAGSAAEAAIVLDLGIVMLWRDSLGRAAEIAHDAFDPCNDGRAQFVR